MNRRKFTRLGVITSLFSTGLLSANQGQLTQVGIAIGNNAYPGKARLVNATKDAQLMHQTFTKLGVRSELVTDLSGNSLQTSIDKFAQRVRKQGVDVAWFFFSGHGARVDGKNLLLGTDVVASNSEQLKSKSFDLAILEGMLDQIRPQVAIVIVDACRDNPFSVTQSASSATRSIAPSPAGLVIREWSGKLVAFSTSAFTKALDWPDQQNGPYAKALSKALLAKQPRSLEKALEAAADEVYRVTSGVQTPGYYSELRRSISIDSNEVKLAAVTSEGIIEIAKQMPKSNIATRTYRPDLIVNDQYADINKEIWVQKTQLLELKARNLERIETDFALAAAKKSSANDSELTLAALLLSSGKLATQNRQLAAKYYEQAALRGFVSAQVLVGELEFDRQNFAQSFKWLTLASKTGWERPKLNLAQLTMQGLGTQQDVNQGLNQVFEVMKDVIRQQGQAPLPR